jgi:hypothetical protein
MRNRTRKEHPARDAGTERDRGQEDPIFIFARFVPLSGHSDFSDFGGTSRPSFP